MKVHKIALFAVAVAGFTQAHATITYDILEAKVTFSDGTVDNLHVSMSGLGNSKLDFTAGAHPLLVGDGALPKDAATIDIIYTATSDVAIKGLDLYFTGWANKKGAVGYDEFIESTTGNATLGSVSGNKYGASLGGSDDPFLVHRGITFHAPVFSYKAKKTFTLADLAQDGESFASIGFIEQNAQPVPEPASLIALGIGGLGILARKRRKT